MLQPAVPLKGSLGSGSTPVSHVVTSLGARLLYRLDDWPGVNADYRTFFVHRGAGDPRVHRFTTGPMISLG